ncbi:MAG: hypothetical protein G8D24_02175 [Buchnera aphidicola (Periphyllus lyropictus)]|uniref:hypothetical protein n=1 Tax=Buchnera aphidicola TaxID=9 RepID=UPI001EB2EBF6|nr:hypothetical protein [Buchnera aphidicola]NIH16844.1 hypothetical protein [Buchnera aphidicola (Periphyllus lyropictus)]USS94714.1 hypothetical protein M5J13_00625 [Buchnera aphidicola (Periphyllus lyropictus)]
MISVFNLKKTDYIYSKKRINSSSSKKNHTNHIRTNNIKNNLISFKSFQFESNNINKNLKLRNIFFKSFINKFLFNKKKHFNLDNKKNVFLKNKKNSFHINNNKKFLNNLNSNIYLKNLGIYKKVYNEIDDNLDDNSTIEDYLNSLKEKLSEMTPNDSKDDVCDDIISSDLVNINWKDFNQVNDYDSSKSLLYNLQKKYLNLIKTKNLSSDFDIYDSTSNFKFENHYVYKHSKCAILNNLKRFFPNLEDRQLISNYVNGKVLLNAHKIFLSEKPEFNKFYPNNSHMNYVITKLPDGYIRLIVMYFTHLGQLDDNSDSSDYSRFGMRAVFILSKDHLPNVKYTYFFK